MLWQDPPRICRNMFFWPWFHCVFGPGMQDKKTLILLNQANDAVSLAARNVPKLAINTVDRLQVGGWLQVGAAGEHRLQAGGVGGQGWGRTGAGLLRAVGVGIACIGVGLLALWSPLFVSFHTSSLGSSPMRRAFLFHVWAPGV